MNRGRLGLLLNAVLVAGLPLGCAQSQPLLGRRTLLGSLKASVSQLEFEREQLRTELAKTQAENRKYEDLLAQQEATNDELATRLDDARHLLRDRGYDEEAVAGPSRPPAQPPATKPAGRTGRKPPFARIPARLDPNSAGEEADPPADDLFDGPTTDRPRAGGLGPQGRLDDRPGWLPVARGVDDPSPRVR